MTTCVFMCTGTQTLSLHISLPHTPFPLQSPAGTLHPHNFRCPFSRVHKKGKLFLSLLHDLALFLPLPLANPRFPSFYSQFHNPSIPWLMTRASQLFFFYLFLSFLSRSLSPLLSISRSPHLYCSSHFSHTLSLLIISLPNPFDLAETCSNSMTLMQSWTLRCFAPFFI